MHAAELAGPAADHVFNALVAALDDLERVDEFGTEMLAAPAVIGEGGQRGQDLELAEIGAVVAFQSPEGHQNRCRHAEALLDAREETGVLLDLLLAVGNAIAAEQAVGEFEEGLLEDRLTTITADHRRVVNHVRRGFRQRPLRDALRHGCALELGQPAGEALRVAAARGRFRPGNARDEDAEQGRRQSQGCFAHC